MELACLRDVDGRAKYTNPILKSHPYLEDAQIEREELPEERPWLGDEGNRSGFRDRRIKALERDGWTCQDCGADLTRKQAEVHHLKPIRKYSNPEAANKLRNLLSLCSRCHGERTTYGKS